MLLETLGIDTRLVTRDRAYLDGDDTPTVASNYASASVYPVAVETALPEEDLVRRCRNSFVPFFEADSVPVRKQTHYYLYEEDVGVTVPPRMGATHISEHTGPLPARSGHSVNDGYLCQEYFVEMPRYMPLLYESYVQSGGTVECRELGHGDVSSLPGDYIVNCSGIGSAELFDDDDMLAIKGHILEVPYSDSPTLDFSYTYTPEDYSHYAYMYPRDQTLLFDGSYLEGKIVDGNWYGEHPSNPTTIDGELIPERLYTVNADVLRNHLTVSRDEISVKHGYRPYRSEGVRIEREGRIVHNYGHGGAGVSLSWVSARQAAGHVTDVPDGVLDTVATRLSDTVTSSAS